MEKLKPCPFCGGKAKIIEYSQKLPNSEVRNCFFVSCGSCGCSPFEFGEICLYYKEDYMERKNALKEKAIKAWNRRPNDVDTKP